MIMDNIPQSILYPAYRGDMDASVQIRRIKACEERWKRIFEGYEAEIGKFGSAVSDIGLCGGEFIDGLERNYLNRIFGCVTGLFGEVEAGEIYNRMMELYAGRYDLDYLFDRLGTMFGIRLRIVNADELGYSAKKGNGARDEIVRLLEMLLPADIHVKVSYVAGSGLGRDSELGKVVLEKGFFLL